jgi:predicted permease
MSDLLQDVRYGVRLLFKDRGFTVAALLTLALCIGANTAIFSIVSSVLLRPLPFSQPEQLVYIYNSYPNAGADRGSTGIPDYYDRLAQTTAFQEIALYQSTGLTIGEVGKPERVQALGVTPSFFRLLRVPPLQGHVFTEQEGEIGNEKNLVLSYSYWKERFGGRNAIGQTLRVAGQSYTIVGVMSRNFVFEDPEIQMYLPLAITQEMRSDDRRHSNSWSMIARMKPGVTLAVAQAQINAVNASNDKRFPAFHELLEKAGFHTVVANYQKDLTRDIRSTLYLLQIGVLMVLLIGCVNIANLILVRSTSRSRELATRAALGAGNMRLIRQLLSESVVLGIMGGALGLLVGFGCLKLFMTFGAEHLPRASEIHLDGVVVAGTIALSIVAGFVFGIIPALRLRGADLNSVFREVGRAVAVSKQAAAARSVLVVTQVALAFAMLIGAGLLLTSFANTLAVDPGFKADRVLTARISLPITRYANVESTRQIEGRILEAARRIPGVESAAMSTAIPLGDEFDSSVMTAEGYVPRADESIVSPKRIMASSSYFETLGIPIIKGRGFTDADREDGMQVAVIDEWIANKYFAGKDPIGKRICQCVPELATADDTIVWKTVVGVAKTVHMETLTGDKTPGQYYFSLPQETRSHVYLIMRAAGEPAALLPALRKAVTSLDPDLPVYSVKTMEENMSASVATARVRTILLAGFGAVAMLLAAIGIYGVLAYSVAQRRAEIGVRLALGSPTSSVFGLVLAQGARLLGWGLLIGGTATIFLSRLVASLLFGVTTTDPVVYALVALVLSAIALVACAVPARRAMLVEPGIALRG